MIKKTLTISMLLLLSQAVNLAVVLPAHAQVQKCKDAQGKWHYGNDLRNVCKNETEIKSVRERVKTPGTTQNESTSEQELTRLELNVLNRKQYLKSELKKILAPYKVEQDVEDRFERLKTNTSSEIDAKEAFLDGLRRKQKTLSNDTVQNSEKSKVLLADNDLRIKSTQADIRELNVKLGQLEQRQTKVVFLFRQFKDKLDQEQAGTAGVE